MGDSQALLSSDGNNSISFPLSSSNAYTEEPLLFAKDTESIFMDSSTNQNNPPSSSSSSSSGLLRFRSAPSFLLENFTDGVVKNSGENHGLTSKFSNSNSCGTYSSNYGFNSQLPPQYPRSSGAIPQLGSVNGGYRVQSSMGTDHQGQSKMGSNLMRQNSSPAELFSHLTSLSGYAAMRSVGGYRLPNGAGGNLSPSSSRLKGPTDFSSGLPSTIGILSRISEVENETGGTCGVDDEKLGSSNCGSQFYGSAFPFGSWNSSSKFTENFTSLKREIDSDQTLFADSQGVEHRNRSHILSQHLGLPKTSAEIAAVGKLLQFQDTVPCKIRAKRGCATHPRSIAERVRRTRISERMRKLQELVPNMEKQTNTADMLDLAVDYIKDLQKQYTILSEIRANCKCSAMQKPIPDQMV